jgi:mono/diheme cytochrome c family protein
MLRTLTRGTLAGLLLGSLACTSPSSESTEVTYYKDVKPILATRCEGCHSATGIGPFDLTTYDTAKGYAPIIAAAAQSGTMPPWMPSPGLSFQHERRMSTAEIQTLKDWVSQGVLEGKPADLPKFNVDQPSIRVSDEVKMDAPYKPNLALGTDDYRCFIVDPKLTADTAVTGFDVRPGNTRIVHHVILYNIDPGGLNQLSQLDANEQGPGYTCFGATNVNSRYQNMVGAWVPGTTATVFPEGTGVVVKAGSKFVMQVHYNMLEIKDGEDQTSIQLEYTPTNVVSGAYIIPALNDSFRVPAGEVQTVKAVFDTAELGAPAGLKIKVHGVLPHMHLHGKSISVSLTKKSTGEKLSLIDIPKWNFHWQQFYFYENAVTVELGDVLNLECTFDNRTEAQPIINGQQVPAKDLTWGEGTLEEMCLNFFYATVE